MANSLKSYPPPWEGGLLLACRKCQKKLKGESGMRALAKLKKTIKRRNKQHPEAALHLIGVRCIDVSPEGRRYDLPSRPDGNGVDSSQRR